MFKKINLLLIVIISTFMLTQPVWANDYAYHGKIKGIVCAFCAYNVSNKIGKVDGIDAASVQVNLKSGEVNFLSTVMVKQAQVASIFADSGFSLLSLNQQAVSNYNPLKYAEKPLVTLSFSFEQIKQLAPVLEAIGNMAAVKTSRLLIHAEKAHEIELLKPIIAGRKRAIKVDFVPTNNFTIELSLFQVAATTTNH